MSFVEGETDSCTKTCVTCDVDRSEEGSIKFEAVYIKDEIPESSSFPPISTEHEVRLWGFFEVVAAHAFRLFIAPTRTL
jgi:hypothetical protein